VARPPGRGLLGRLLSWAGPSGERSGDAPPEAARDEAEERLEAARARLKQTIPPPEDQPPEPGA
jgi:hypothetical protein